MSLAGYARLMRLLHRAASGASGQDFDVNERRDEVAGDGWQVDRYEPRGRIRSTVLFLHGFTLAGKNDHRLVSFCRAAASLGTRCVVPTLPGLARLDWALEDIDGLCRLILQESTASGAPVGLVGFSFAGGYALLAAARPEVAPQVRWVIGVGAFYDLAALHAELCERNYRWQPASPREWDAWTYEQLVLAYRHQQGLGLSAEHRGELRALLEGYCDKKNLQEARRFVESYLVPLNLAQRENSQRDSTSLERLSPAGKLGGLRCYVGLVHDPGDLTVPADQARRLLNELERVPVGRHRLVLTSLLDHVELSSAWKVHELAQLARVLVPVVE